MNVSLSRHICKYCGFFFLKNLTPLIFSSRTNRLRASRQIHSRWIWVSPGSYLRRRLPTAQYVVSSVFSFHWRPRIFDDQTSTSINYFCHCSRQDDRSQSTFTTGSIGHHSVIYSRRRSRFFCIQWRAKCCLIPTYFTPRQSGSITAIIRLFTFTLRLW